MMTMGILLNTEAANELQNFANWYSYYRKRELAAKAAVAEVIVNSKGFRSGFYSLHDNNSGHPAAGSYRCGSPAKLTKRATLLNHTVDDGLFWRERH